jgi:DNA-binding transcriptional LysR family regulator
MDETFRRNWAVEVAKERVEEAKARSRTVASEPQRRQIERSPWLGVQIRSLLALIAVAEEGSFIAAATRLGYSRSTISHQIAQLEAAIGGSLLVRGSGYRSVTLTPAGRVVVTHGRAVLRVLENAESQLADLNRRQSRRAVLRGLSPQGA